MKSTEFEIPVPWGQITVKSWGKELNPPIILIHGIGDNAGSFDRLISNLPSSFYYLCIDLPSHGKSSLHPPFLCITALDNMVAIKLLLDHLNRKKYIFIGHSWGGQVLAFFAQLFPKYFVKLVLLDSFYLRPTPTFDFKSMLRNKIEGLIKVSKFTGNSKRPNHTFDEVVNKVINSRANAIKLNKEAATALVTRALVKNKDMFGFYTDPRLKYRLDLIRDIKDSVEIVQKCLPQCPLLIIYSTDSVLNTYKPILEKYVLLKQISIFKVEGGHDFHMNNVDVVAPIISHFLLGFSSKL